MRNYLAPEMDKRKVEKEELIESNAMSSGMRLPIAVNFCLPTKDQKNQKRKRRRKKIWK